MPFIEVFIVAFVVSYAGSIPPGTINVSVMQLSIQNHRRAAVFLGIGASAVEFVYAGITVKFQQFLVANENLNFYFQIVTGGALVIMGLFNMFSRAKSSNFKQTQGVRRRIGFARGVVLGLVNPLTIPFWLAVTTYLETHKWINLIGNNFWAYISGLAAGTFILLVCVDLLGSKFQKIADNTFLVMRVPGIILMSMGVYNFWILFT